MLNKSLILGTLLVSTTFGAALPETGLDASLDLAGIERMKGELSPYLVLHTPESRAHAIAEFTKAAAVLLSNPMMAETEPTTIEGIGNILLSLGEEEAAIALYKFVLTLDKPVFGRSMAQTCSRLYDRGETDLAIATLKELIGDASLANEIRQDAIGEFYCINSEAHGAEAREIWANLQVQAGQIATIEKAREAAKSKYPTAEEMVAAEEKACEAEAGYDFDSSDLPPLEAA